MVAGFDRRVTFTQLKADRKKFCDEWGVCDKLTVSARPTRSGWGVGW